MAWKINYNVQFSLCFSWHYLHWHTYIGKKLCPLQTSIFIVLLAVCFSIWLCCKSLKHLCCQIDDVSLICMCFLDRQDEREGICRCARRTGCHHQIQALKKYRRAAEVHRRLSHQQVSSHHPTLHSQGGKQSGTKCFFF